ncbi:MAG: hypothetical protein JWN01_705 [Patescibacteria group bacterium]|nr:hypothetical protein [Patescibacteria group bacterium]
MSVSPDKDREPGDETQKTGLPEKLFWTICFVVPCLLLGAFLAALLAVVRIPVVVTFPVGTFLALLFVWPMVIKGIWSE